MLEPEDSSKESSLWKFLEMMDWVWLQKVKEHTKNKERGEPARSFIRLGWVGEMKGAGPDEVERQVLLNQDGERGGARMEKWAGGS